MAGQRVTWQMRPSEIEPWTEPEVRQMVQDTFSVDDEKAKEAKKTNITNNIVFIIHNRPLSLVQEYLGEDICVDGGSIGEPVTRPEYVHILRMHLVGLCFRPMERYFSPPRTPKYCTMLALTNFLWYYFEYHN